MTEIDQKRLNLIPIEVHMYQKEVKLIRINKKARRNDEKQPLTIATEN